MNVVTYSRVSTLDQTLEPQEIELRAWCERQGWAIQAEYRDVISGSKAERPGLTKMLAACRRGGVGAVVCVKLDRLGRSLINVVSLIADLEKMGVAVVCTSQGIDTRADNPCGRVTIAILAAISEFERNLVRERTIAGLAAARKRGSILGRPSVLLPEDWKKRLAAWRKETGGVGVRELARRINGISSSTAAKLARENP
jgi:DNA invertase Pin-like site-specific DNA recombinase